VKQRNGSFHVDSDLGRVRRAKEGFVLPLVMLIFGALVLVGAASYVATFRNFGSTASYVHRTRSFYQAKAGGVYVFDRLCEDVKAGTLTLNQPSTTVSYSAPSGYHFDPVTQILRLGDDHAFVFEVTGRSGNARTTLEIVFRKPQESPFDDFFSDDTMTISGGGSVVGNARSNSDITNSGGSTITGNAKPGPGCSVSDPANVTGATTPATTTLAIPPLDPGEVAAAMSSNNNGALNPAYYDAGSQTYEQSGGVYVMPAGTYFFTEFKTSGGAVTAVGGPVVIYCSGKFVVSGGGFTNPSSNPDDLIINSVAVDQVVEWSGTSDCHARIYAPDAKETKVTGGGNFVGSIVTKGKLTASGSSTLVGYGGGGGSSGPPLLLGAWREPF
jgi:hypothetical protein